MNDLEEKILSYPHLSGEEQREIEAYVEEHPEWAPLLRDVRSVEGLSANVRADLPSDSLLATYVIVQHLHPNGDRELSEELRTAFTRLEARIEEEEPLRREVEAAKRRLQEAESSIDPVAQFETLTEHSLRPELGAESSKNKTPDSDAEASPRTSPSWWEAVLALPRFARLGGAVAAVLMALYAGLYGASVATQSTLDRLAAPEVSEQVVDSYTSAEMRTAGSATEGASVDDQYLDALSHLRAAHVSTLGLFPRYDAERLDQARQGFGQVLEEVEPSSFLALEAHFYLGKIALAQDDIATARTHFKTVVQREGRQAQAAYEILKTLQREYEEGNS
jgi:TolA-binding protein